MIAALALLLTSVRGRAQMQDSLRSIWSDKTLNDTVRLKAMEKLAPMVMYADPDSGYKLAQLQYEMAQATGHTKWAVDARNTQAVSYAIRGDLDKALGMFNEVLSLSKGMGQLTSQASALSNIGNVHLVQGDLVGALDNYLKSQELYERIGDVKRQATVWMNIGNIQSDLGDENEATASYTRSLELARKAHDDKQIAGASGSLANLLENEGAYDRALDLNLEAVRLCRKLKNRQDEAVGHIGLGGLYRRMKDPVRAAAHLDTALTMLAEVGDSLNMANALVTYGKLKNDLGRYGPARDLCLRALRMAGSIGNARNTEGACDCLHAAYKGLGESAKALAYYERARALADSTSDRRKLAETTRMVMRKGFLAEQRADSIQFAASQSIQRLEIARQNTRVKAQRVIIISSGIALALLLALVLAIRRGKRRSDALLRNILPHQVAEELKARGRVEARLFDQVTVLFADIREFTVLSSAMTAPELVAELHHCFKAFDGIITQRGIEKIKTIGDAYVAAAGLPEPGRASAATVVEAALAVQRFVIARAVERTAQGLPAFHFRIGIHSGPVVAGVVGVKKFQYDIWGDTVNIAARMEQNSEPDKVNISSSTYALVREDAAFHFLPRGRVAVKGKDEMEMWFVREADGARSAVA